MKIRNFVHKGLQRLYEDDSSKSVPPDTVDKLRKMLAYLDNIQDEEELRALKIWKAHLLTGDRQGTWSLSFTRNRRLTFRIDAPKQDYEWQPYCDDSDNRLVQFGKNRKQEADCIDIDDQEIQKTDGHFQDTELELR